MFFPTILVEYFLDKKEEIKLSKLNPYWMLNLFLLSSILAQGFLLGNHVDLLGLILGFVLKVMPWFDCLTLILIPSLLLMQALFVCS